MGGCTRNVEWWWCSRSSSRNHAAKWRHQILLDTCERLQDLLLGGLLTDAGGDDLDALVPGDTVLVRMKKRKQNKLQASWAGPYLVVDHDEVDAGHPMLCLQHLATKAVGCFPLCDLKRCNLDQYANVEAVLPVAALDNFEYAVAEVIDHRPKQRRMEKGSATWLFKQSEEPP
jgi:hypothetical protein